MKLKLKDNEFCIFCKVEVEIIEYFFYDCFNVKEIWCVVEEMFLLKFNFLIVFDKIGVLFGKFNNNNIYKVYNLLIFVVKQFIFVCKYKMVFKLDMSVLFIIIINRLFIEKYLFLKNCNFIQYEKYLKQICDLF